MNFKSYFAKLKKKKKMHPYIFKGEKKIELNNELGADQKNELGN